MSTCFSDRLSVPSPRSLNGVATAADSKRLPSSVKASSGLTRTCRCEGSELMKGTASSSARSWWVACIGASVKSALPCVSTMLCTAKRAGSALPGSLASRARMSSISKRPSATRVRRSSGASISSRSITGARRSSDSKAASACRRRTRSNGAAGTSPAAFGGGPATTRSFSVSSSVHGLKATAPRLTRRPSFSPAMRSACSRISGGA